MGQCKSKSGTGRSKGKAPENQAVKTRLIHDWTDDLMATCRAAVLPEACEPEKTTIYDHYPAFLTGVLHQIWPFLIQYVFDLIVDAVEPAVQKSVGHSFFIDRHSSLGSHPLTFDEARISRTTQKTADGEISNLVIKASVDWLTDSDFAFHFGKAVLGIKGISIRGEVMVEFVGMLSRSPMFEAIRVYFIVPPEV
jgi:hypothetical protein